MTAKKLTFYNGSKVAYTVPKGKVVTLTKLSLSKDVIYLQFKYGKKTGWAHVNGTKYNFSKPWFQGVNARLVPLKTPSLRAKMPAAMVRHSTTGRCEFVKNALKIC